MSEIQSLTLRVQSLSHSVDWWNTAMIWGLAMAAVAAVFVVIATRIVVTRTGELSAAQDLLSEAKDRQLALDLKGKDKEIGELTLKSESLSAEAEKAKEGIATAQAEEAKSKLALETFRAQQANPRMIILSDRDGDHAERSRRASEVNKFSGTHVLIQALPDFEPRALAGAIALELAKEYKWQVEMIDPEHSRIPFSILSPGVKVITLEEAILEPGDPATAKVKMPAPAKSKSYPAALAIVDLLDLDLGEPYGPPRPAALHGLRYARLTVRPNRITCRIGV